MTTEQVIEPLTGLEALSGEDIVSDLVTQVAAGLSANCYLRGLDSYASYSAIIQISLQLKDLDVIQVDQNLAIGVHDPGRPSRPIKVKIAETTVEIVRERSGLLPPSLERMIDGNIPPATSQKKRFYAPRAKGSAG
jgi:hypothetical protein